MKIYTKTGDKGETSLYDGTRIRKDDLRVDCYGTIDELNSFLGFARGFIEDKEIIDIIYDIQRDLFNVGGELATKDGGRFPERVKAQHIARLEEIIDNYLAKIQQVDLFIIPGTNQASASLHVARTVCRRAERSILTLSQREAISEDLLKYMNRLSDAIYTLARYLESQLRYVKFHKE